MMPMSLTTLRRASRVALCLFALTCAAHAVRADEPAGVSWSALSPPQQQVLHSFEERWSQLPPDRQAALANGSGRWLAMTPEQRSQAQDRFQRWHALPPAQREQMRERWRQFRALPPEQQQRQCLRGTRWWPLRSPSGMSTCMPPAAG